MSVEPTADRRLGPYVVLAVGGVVGALVTGQVALVAVAAPAAVLVVTALADRRPVDVRVGAVHAPLRLLEGDAWVLEVELVWTGRAVVDVVHTGVPGHRFTDARGIRAEGDGGTTVRLAVTAEHWGRHGLGALTVRSRRRPGMLRWDSELALEGAVHVLPRAATLDHLLAPRRPRIAAGAHAAPVRGPGTDFADLRPYAPGDRLRDVSWAATARSDRPWVVVHHPERAASIVLLLDGFVEVGAPAGSLDRAARVVWSIARRHLASGDRVGLVSTGAVPVWIAPVSGRRARWQVLEALLAVGAQVSRSGADSGLRERGASERRHRDVALPADAVIIGVSPLQSDAFVAATAHHARLGRPTAVVGVEIADLLPPPTDEVERAARRLWAADVDARTGRLARAGIPTVRVVDDPAPGIALLARRLAPLRRWAA